MTVLNSVEAQPTAPQVLQIPEGPWNVDVWHIPRVQQVSVPTGDNACAVTTCERAAGRIIGEATKDTDVLCLGHRRRFWKRGQQMSVAEFISQQGHLRPICRPRGKPPARKDFCDPVDFTKVSPILANELRYIVAVKSTRFIWREPNYVASVLRTAIKLASKYNFDSLRDFPTAPTEIHDRHERLHAMFPCETGPGAMNLVAAIPGMLALLDDAATDPWDGDVWHPSQFDLSGRQDLVALPKIYWSRVTCEWLRLGLKKLAREQLQSGARSWATIHSYTRGGSLFSRYLDSEVGHVKPAGLNRELFLNFVAWAWAGHSGPTDRHAVNTLARLLLDLRLGGHVDELPDTPLLLRGEAVIPKTRKPKPFPADILAKIDILIADESALPRGERLILRLCRAIGPRISEALTLQRDCVSHHSDRGYTIQYFQTKVQEWRRVPLPAKLGEDLVAHSNWIEETRGPSCQWMFPYTGYRPRTNTLAQAAGDAGPWPLNRFRDFLWKVYQRHGIIRSDLTGETLTGVQIHRFRHSLATGLLNEGWSQYEVQTFLGHKSPTMMQAYAEINDDKLRSKYLEFVNESVDIDGRVVTPPDEATIDVERLRDRFIRSTLPNGFCTLPEKQKCDYLPSPCLSCTFFRTTKTFLPVHIRQRDDAIRELDLARTDGRQRSVEAHEKTVSRLTAIIDGLGDVPQGEVLSDD